MTLSERVYRALLVAYPEEHRRLYGEAMVQLFRDDQRHSRTRFRVVVLWVLLAGDLVRSAFTERMETTMNTQTWTSRWWEATVVLLAANSIFFGVIAANNDQPQWAILSGFVPAGLLLAGLALRNTWRTAATVIIVVASLAAAAWFWMIYPAVLAAFVIIGGIAKHKIGPKRLQTQPVT